MPFKRKLIISFFLIQNSVFALPPIDSCNMNGTWYMEVMPAYQFHIVQSGSSLIITTPTWPPESQLRGAGSMMPWGAEFYLTGMGSITNFKGVFINSCFSMIWSSINRLGDIEEYTMLRVPIKIVEPTEQELVITSEPRMPNFKARVVLDNPLVLNKVNGNIPAYIWGVRIKHDIGSDLHINAKIDDFKTNSDTYLPDFSTLKDIIKKDGAAVNLEGNVVGGELTLSVDYYENLHIEKKYSILKGTNPGQSAIEQVLTDKTLRQIACQESRYKHFDARREGGIGKPNGKTDPFRGGLGIMQLFDPMPTSAQVWNWRENLKAGAKLYNDKLTEAMKLPRRELKDLNEERDALGLPRCTSPLPEFNSEQLARETLRRYNCGKEYRWEPRNAPNCKGNWVISPSCKITHPDAYDAEYVDKVLKCDINR